MFFPSLTLKILGAGGEGGGVNLNRPREREKEGESKVVQKIWRFFSSIITSFISFFDLVPNKLMTLVYNTWCQHFYLNLQLTLTLYGPGFWGAPQDRGGLIQPPPQYLGLYLSVANKTWQIYKTNQNKVIDIKKIMLTLQNVADVIKN